MSIQFNSSEYVTIAGHESHIDFEHNAKNIRACVEWCASEVAKRYCNNACDKKDWYEDQYKKRCDATVCPFFKPGSKKFECAGFEHDYFQDYVDELEQQLAAQAVGNIAAALRHNKRALKFKELSDKQRESGELYG